MQPPSLNFFIEMLLLEKIKRMQVAYQLYYYPYCPCSSAFIALPSLLSSSINLFTRHNNIGLFAYHTVILHKFVQS